MRWRYGWALLLLFASSLEWGCAAQVRSGRAFTDARQLAALEKGVSTRRDVQRLLGAPDGSGHALLPNDETPLDLWYYADISVTDLRQVSGGFRGDVKQQMLLVSFRGETFEGYMWWSNQGGLN